MELLHWRRRLGLLKKKQVDLLLCGGIRRRDCFSLINAGIDIRAGLMGEVDDILQAFLRGEVLGMNPGDQWRINFHKEGKGWRRGRRGRPGMGMKS
jgi:predicted Fe-Mo cluster-binding NifX family protein